LRKGLNVTLASDQHLDPVTLSETARKMLALREAVFEEWEKRVRDSIEEARNLHHPVLINSLPSYYENLVQSIAPNYPRTTATDTTTLAGEHGGERARLTDYDPEAVIHEYQIFRWTIFDVLKAHNIELSETERNAINTSIDVALREAVMAFSLILAALREQFIATLAHDLRNPLNTASIAVQMIEKQTDSPLIRKLASRAKQNHERIDEMTQGLLDSLVFRKGRRLPLDLSEFDILPLLHEIVDQAKTVYGPRIQLLGKSIVGYWHRESLRRATENLITNAVKYGKPDSPIRIQIQDFHERLQVSVHNEGEPIPPNERESVFLIFERSQSVKDKNVNGWGIGLPFVRSVAESHGGMISLDSSDERGTTFVIDIPKDARPFQHAPAFRDRRQSIR
jgi:signal transduction histidine kinase